MIYTQIPARYIDIDLLLDQFYENRQYIKGIVEGFSGEYISSDMTKQHHLKEYKKESNRISNIIKSESIDLSEYYPNGEFREEWMNDTIQNKILYNHNVPDFMNLWFDLENRSLVHSIKQILYKHKQMMSKNRYCHQYQDFDLKMFLRKRDSQNQDFFQRIQYAETISKEYAKIKRDKTRAKLDEFFKKPR